MISKYPSAWLKNNWFTVLLVAFIFLMIISPASKAWLLQQLVSTGFFKADIAKEGAYSSSPADTNFAFTDAAGNTTTTASLKGKVVFINFWASWCAPCRAEMPSLNNLYQKLQADKRIVFLFMNEDEDKAKANSYLAKYGFPIPVYFTAGPVPAGLYSGSLPTTIVLNKDGKVVLRHEGMAGYDTESFLRQLKSLL